MARTRFIGRICKRLRALRKANGANVTITFALATIPVMGFVGAAVDYSHANSVKAAMQAAVDATGLMLSKEVGTLTESEIQTKAEGYFKAVFNRAEALDAHVSIQYSPGTSQVLVTGSAYVETNFMSVMGFPYLTVGAQSLAKWGNTRLRVSLVLDTTGSMASSGKIDALKTATKNLLDQLKGAAANDGDVYVSIVPFVKDTNVGASNYTATWIDWSDWNDNNGNCTGYSGWGTPHTKSSCLSKGGNWTPDNHNTWNGCVTDRGNSSGPSSGNYDTNVTPPTTGIKATMFSAEQYGSCPQAAMALSYDWAGMKTLVDAMSPSGNTNQGIGLAHGWMSLVGGGPYPPPPPEDPKYIYTKVIILLSDGMNTQNRWTTSTSSIDAREKITCDNVHAAGVTLYTVQVNTDGDPTSTLLKNCAGSPGKYPDSEKFFLLTSATQIVSTFQQIGTKLSNLRIAK